MNLSFTIRGWTESEVRFKAELKAKEYPTTNFKMESPVKVRALSTLYLKPWQLHMYELDE